MSTKSRREFIKKVIAEQEISKQDELVKILNENNFKSTQATVSRDINELGLVKVSGKTVKSKYAMPEEKFDMSISNDKVITLLKTFILSVERAKNLVVVKTLVGNGSSCGMAIDKIKPKGVVGSIAGDDTLLIVTHSDEEAENVVLFIKDLIRLWF